jgi:hypothetical protein
MDFIAEKKEIVTEKGIDAFREKERLFTAASWQGYVIREGFVPERMINHKICVRTKKKRLFFIRFLLKKLE